MALTPAEMNQIKTNLNRLDYLKGTGVIATHKRKLANDVYLFISSGGNGHKALCTLRDQLRWKVDPQELADKVSFLAIDAAWKEIDDLVHLHGFSENEVLRLPYEDAHESINPATMSPQMRQWVDPGLYEATGNQGQTAAALSGFDETGAGAWRQPGRVRLSQQNSVSKLTALLSSCVTHLLAGRATGTRLKVFFLAGLAGGTGSGTIIDLAFMTRQILHDRFRAIYERSQIVAYLMLPSACGNAADAVAEAKGNRNCYAALKEIDYYMGLQGRGESFQQDYGGFQVNISENIFHFCTLVEGVADGGVIFGSPAETARKVVANSILNLICATEEKQGNDDPFLVDSFLSNKANITNAIARQAPRLFPRSSNYCYNVIGYASCVIPIDLMTVYVANKVFQRVWDLFAQAGTATPEAAEDFLADAQLLPKDVRDAANYTAVRERFEKQADIVFRKKGPYYMVNLLNEIRDVLHAPGKFANYASSKVSGILGRNEKWATAESRYQKLEDDVVGPMNSQLYEVYTRVIDELKTLLANNAKLLTDTREHRNMFGRSFNWSPIDLTPGDRASTAVITYLDGLLSPAEIQQKAKNFVDMLCDNKAAWTQLVAPKGSAHASFDAAAQIRDFIQKEFSSMVNSTMESYLVKLYSNDPTAEVPNVPEDQNPAGHLPLREAAAAIVQYLDSNAGAMVQTRKGFLLDSCTNQRYIVLPEGCRYLQDHVRDYAVYNHIVGGPDQIYKSSSQEEIVLYRLYIGVPAWAIEWTQRAEQDYELNDGPSSVGLHLEHGANGHDWARYPDLVDRTLFQGQFDGYNWALREVQIEKEAADDLEHATELGLVKQPAADNGAADPAYVLRLPNITFTAKDLLNAAQLDPKTEYTPDQLFDLLLDQKLTNALGYPESAIKQVNLKYGGQVMTTTDYPAPKDFGWNLAKMGLRRRMDDWTALKAAFPLVEELLHLLDAHNKDARLRVRAAQRRNVFKDCLIMGLLKYSALRNCWYQELGDEKPLDEPLRIRWQQECKEYFAALAFYTLDDSVYQDYEIAVNATATDEELKERAEHSKALRKSYMTLRNQRSATDDIRYPMASAAFEEEVGEELAQRVRSFYDWLISNT